MTPRLLSVAAVALALSTPSAAQVFGYAVNSDDAANAFQLLRVDLVSGEYTLVGQSGYVDVEGMAFSADGELYGIDDATRTLLRFDLASGVARPVDLRRSNLRLPDLNGAFSNNYDFGLTFDCEGRLWASSDTLSLLWQVDPESGDSLQVLDLGVAITGLAARWDGIYGLGAAGDEGIYRIDLDSASATQIASFGGLQFVDGGLDFDADGVLWAIPEFTPIVPAGLPSPIYRINVDTGVVQFSADTRSGIEGLAIAPPQCIPRGNAVVQEIPSTSMLGKVSLAALLLLLGMRFASSRTPARPR